MTAIIAGRTERNSVLLPINISHGNRRACTDKYWSILFIALIIILVATARRGIIHREPECQDNHDRISATNVATKFFDNKIDCKDTSDNQTFMNKIIEFVPLVWGKNWLFDAVTCNVAFLDANYERSGSIVIWTYVLICVCLIYYSFASTRTDSFYVEQSQRFAFFVTSCSLLVHTLIYDKKLSDPLRLVQYWVVTEVIFIIILCSKWSRLIVDSADSDEVKIANERVGRGSFCALLVFQMFQIILLFTVIFVDKYKLDWNNQQSYAFVGILCYVYLTFYYFMLMVVSCATSLTLERELPRLKDAFRAVFIVARYHFGTACYHATLIFPRIHVTLLANQKEFRKIATFSAIKRTFLAHWKVHDLALTMVAARGHCGHSESTRELLRLYASDSPKLRNFQIQSQVCRRYSALLMAIDTLLLIGLWAHSVALDPVFAMGVWIVRLFGMLISYFLARLFDALTDTIWFTYGGNVMHKL